MNQNQFDELKQELQDCYKHLMIAVTQSSVEDAARYAPLGQSIYRAISKLEAIPVVKDSFTTQGEAPSKFGSPELQTMIVERAIEKINEVTRLRKIKENVLIKYSPNFVAGWNAAIDEMSTTPPAAQPDPSQLGFFGQLSNEDKDSFVAQAYGYDKKEILRRIAIFNASLSTGENK